MNKLLLFISLFAWSFLLAQEDENLFYKDLSGNNEAFYSSLLTNIQTGKLEMNDTAYWMIDSSIAYFSNKNEPCYLSQAYALKGRMNHKGGRFDSATSYFINAAKMLKPSCPSINQYYLYNTWALLAKRIADYHNSDSLNDLAFQAALQIEDKTYLLNVMVNKSILYSEMDDYKKAIRLMKEVQVKATEYDFYYHKQLSLQNLGAFYIDIEDYDSALFAYEMLNEIITEETPPRVIMDLNNNVGLIYFRKGEFAKADFHYKTALNLAKEHNELDVRLIYLENYANLKYEQGEYKLSKEYLDEFIALKDSLFDAEKFVILKNLETQFKTAKQREKILELEKKALSQNLEIEHKNKNRNTLLFIILGFIFIVVSLYVRIKYINKSKRIVEKQKQRSEELLLNILPEEVAEELKNNGSSPAKNFAQASVLFTDFKDFTKLSERMGAQELVEEINFFFKAFDHIVTKYKIEKIKTIGDAYMAASGVPKTEPGDEKRIILAALEMLAVSVERNAELEKANKPRFDIRIGIHTGPLVAGIVGVKKFQYDIWGDTVNTAARIETACEIGKVNISQTTFDSIKEENEFEFVDRGFIDTKGKGKLAMYFVSLKNN